MKCKQRTLRIIERAIKKGKRALRGFTLIELLVVIAIIGVLSATVLVAMNSSRHKAKVARVQGDLNRLRTAMGLLESDTGKWPNGCQMDATNNPEVYLNDQQSGIRIQPSVGVIDVNCEWTAQDVANWRGPYAPNALDPWGTSYYFDPDYCDSNAVVRPAILSVGPDLQEQYKHSSCMAGPPLPGSASSDDITLYLK